MKTFYRIFFASVQKSRKLFFGGSILSFLSLLSFFTSEWLPSPKKRKMSFDRRRSLVDRFFVGSTSKTRTSKDNLTPPTPRENGDSEESAQQQQQLGDFQVFVGGGHEKDLFQELIRESDFELPEWILSKYSIPKPGGQKNSSGVIPSSSSTGNIFSGSRTPPKAFQTPPRSDPTPNLQSTTSFFPNSSPSSSISTSSKWEAFILALDDCQELTRFFRKIVREELQKDPHTPLRVSSSVTNCFSIILEMMPCKFLKKSLKKMASHAHFEGQTTGALVHEIREDPEKRALVVDTLDEICQDIRDNFPLQLKYLLRICVEEYKDLRIPNDPRYMDDTKILQWILCLAMLYFITPSLVYPERIMSKSSCRFMTKHLSIVPRILAILLQKGSSGVIFGQSQSLSTFNDYILSRSQLFHDVSIELSLSSMEKTSHPNVFLKLETPSDSGSSLVTLTESFSGQSPFLTSQRTTPEPEETKEKKMLRKTYSLGDLTPRKLLVGQKGKSLPCSRGGSLSPREEEGITSKSPHLLPYLSQRQEKTKPVPPLQQQPPQLLRSARSQIQPQILRPLPPQQPQRSSQPPKRPSRPPPLQLNELTIPKPPSPLFASDPFPVSPRENSGNRRRCRSTQGPVEVNHFLENISSENRLWRDFPLHEKKMKRNLSFKEIQYLKPKSIRESQLKRQHALTQLLEDLLQDELEREGTEKEDKSTTVQTTTNVWCSRCSSKVTNLRICEECLNSFCVDCFKLPAFKNPCQNGINHKFSLISKAIPRANDRNCIRQNPNIKRTLPINHFQLEDCGRCSGETKEWSKCNKCSELHCENCQKVSVAKNPCTDGSGHAYKKELLPDFHPLSSFCLPLDATKESECGRCSQVSAEWKRCLSCQEVFCGRCCDLKTLKNPCIGGLRHQYELTDDVSLLFFDDEYLSTVQTAQTSLTPEHLERISEKLTKMIVILKPA